MGDEVNRITGEAQAPQYNPMHDYQNISVADWSGQWWIHVAGLNKGSLQYQQTEQYVAAQLGLHPAVREADAEDLNFMMELLGLIGSQNPHNAESDSQIERFQHESWERYKSLAQMFGRQVVRNTLKDAETYAVLRMEQERSGTDYLTGVSSRFGLERGLSDLCYITGAQQRMNKQGELLEPMRLTHVYADANKFKWINDTLGHHIGDAAIVEASWELQNMFRGSDIIYRHGGDEFGVILLRLTDEQVDAVVERVISQQLNKAMSEDYRQAIAAVRRRVQEVREAGWHLRVEARQVEITGQERALGQRPYYVLYINGEAVTELRRIVTLAIGAKSDFVSNLSDVEEMRRAAELAMQGAKSVFRSILADVYGG